jgi:hypothetical protein
VVLLEKKNAMELAGEQQPDKAFIKSALRTFSIVLGMLVVTEVTAMGIANDLVNSEKMTIADDVMAAAIIAECVALEGIVMACSISLARIADAAVAAPSIAEQIATAKQAAVEAAGKNADLQVKELKDLIIDTQNATAQDLDAITGSIKREINNALTQITTGADIVFNMTSSATMQCNAVIAKTSSYVSVLPAETSIGYACEDPLAPTEVAVSACKVRLSVGPLAPAEGTASITITSAGITLLVGVPGTGSSIEMTPEGIVINSPKISITSEGGVNIISPTKVTGVVSITGDMSISGAASISTNLDVTASLTVNGGTSLLGALTVVGPEVNLVP